MLRIDRSARYVIEKTAQSIAHRRYNHAAVARPAGVRVGWSPELVTSVHPFTSQILFARGRSFENIAIVYCVPTKTNGDSGDNAPEALMRPRKVADC